MIPKFLKPHQRLQSFYRDFLRSRIETYLGPLNKARKQIRFEGNSAEIQRPGAKPESSTPFTSESVLKFTRSEAASMSLTDVLARLDSLAQDMARQQAKGAYQAISTILENSGQVTDAKGRKFNWDMYIEMIEMLELDFTDSGEPIIPPIHANPETLKGITKALAEPMDAATQEKYNQLISKKKEAWRAREADRKLVG